MTLKQKLLIILATLLSMTACDKDEHLVPDWNEGGGTPNPVPDVVEPGEMYSWESARPGLLDYTDMVLFYGGGRQRKINKYYWDKDRIQSYVTYKNRAGNEVWFFDAFLFIEFADYGEGSNNVTYASGYKDSAGNLYNSATKADWDRLIDYYFERNHNLEALDLYIGECIARLGLPNRKHRVVITVPEPIKHLNCGKPESSTTYWGKLNGVTLDFAKDVDRVAAVKWYIDRVRAMFNSRGYKNIELAGFYWVSEHTADTSNILFAISKYLNSVNESFNWIPYFNAVGYQSWSSYGFNYAFLQPNYFFNSSTPESRLDEACAMGLKYGMGMEIEFDDNAHSMLGSKSAYKLRNYMNSFTKHGIWENCRLAYYQGNNTVHNLCVSSNSADVDLFHEFATWVTTRPYRTKK